MKYSYLFGPVPSRRLGLSLGVDLVPHKVCTLNCVYCECGGTTRLTTTRAEFVPTDAVKRELEDILATQPRLDAVTFSGAGEPTLHSGLGELIGFIRDRFPTYPVVVLTNGTLLGDPQVRRELCRAQIVIPSLDAVTPETLERLNRPATGITAAGHLEGLRAFQAEFEGEFWLECFIVPGLNDGEEELERLSLAIRELAPQRVQINTLDRPGTESWVKAATPERLRRIASRLSAELIAAPTGCGPKEEQPDTAAANTGLRLRAIELLRRRPCTAADLAAALGADSLQVDQLLTDLAASGNLKREEQQRGVFYRWRAPEK